MIEDCPKQLAKQSFLVYVQFEFALVLVALPVRAERLPQTSALFRHQLVRQFASVA